VADDGLRSVAELLARSGLAERAADVHLELLAGGYRNRVHRWRRPAPAVDAVVKVFVDSPENPLFPTLADHECAALELLRGTGAAPEPIAHLFGPAGEEVLVYEMVSGEPWSSDPGLAGRLLRRVHDVDPDATSFEFRTLAIRADQLVEQARVIADRVTSPAIAASVARMIRRAEHAAGSEPWVEGGCLVHTDPGPGNMIVGPAGAAMIDWQCPGRGDPVEDLAAFTSPAIQILYGRPPLSAVDVGALLDAHAGSGGGPAAARSAAERTAALAPCYAARLAAYCGYRADALRDDAPAVSERYSVALAAELEFAEANDA
jgi:aminoglycoside phosphotransferase (APT) family kinase protein